MKKHWRLFIVLAVLLAAVWIIVFHFAPVYRYFILPVTRVAWLIASLFRAVDQQVFWFIPILLCLVFLFWVLLRRMNDEEPAQRYWGESAPVRDTDHWMHLLTHAADSSYIQHSLVKNLLMLQQSIDDLSAENTGEGEVGEKPRLRGWTLPDRPEETSTPLTDIIPALKQRRLRKIQQNADEVISNLEKAMEIKDGKNNQQ
jgi:hypothetical protein